MIPASQSNPAVRPPESCASSKEPPSISLFTIIVVATLLLFAYIAAAVRPPWVPDELRVCAICHEMTTSGNYLIPTLAKEPFVEKPPLFYSLSALSMKFCSGLLGRTASVRLIVLLFSIGTLWITYRLAQQLVGQKTALWAPAVLISIEGFFEDGLLRIRTDVALVFFVALAWLFFNDGYTRNHPKRYIWMGVALAFAFLTKGVIGVGLPLACMAFFFWWAHRPEDTASRPFCVRAILARTRDTLWFFLQPLMLLGYAVVAVAVFGWMVALRFAGGPDLFHFWLVENTIGRITGSSALGHHKGTFYYAMQLPVLLLPWTLVLVWWVSRLAKRSQDTNRLSDSGKLALAWAIGGTVLLSLPSTKRAIYLLPVMPGFALAAAIAIKHKARDTKWLRAFVRGWTAIATIVVATLALTPSAWRYAPHVSLSSHESSRLTRYKHLFEGPFPGGPLVVGLAILLGAIVIAGVVRLRRRPFEQMLTATTGLWVALFIVVGAIRTPLHDYRPYARELMRRIPSDMHFRVASWRLDEGSRAGLFYYKGVVFPRLERQGNGRQRLVKILKGEDSRFAGVLVRDRLEQEKKLPPHVVVFDIPGPRKRYKLVASPAIARSFLESSAKR